MAGIEKKEREKSKAEEKGEIRINEKDIELLLKIHEQKFLTLELLLKWFSPEEVELKPRPSLYFRLNRMIRAGFLRKTTQDGFQIYLLDRGALSLIEKVNIYGLQIILPIELATIRHDLACASVRHYVETLGARHWISDRVLRTKGDGLNHICDGAFSFGDKTVFVELELSQKSNDRYDRIAEFYTREKGPDRVIYFYGTRKIVEPLMTRVGGHQRLGFFPYNDLLKSPESIEGISAGKAISLKDFLWG